MESRMFTSSRAAMLIVGASMVMISGCATRTVYVERRSYPVAPPPPPPAQLAQGPQYAPQGEVVVTQPPPPTEVVQEVIVASPGPEYVWISGGYEWIGGRWMWYGGRWERPYHHGAVWVRSGWRPTRGGYVWERGRWR